MNVLVLAGCGLAVLGGIAGLLHHHEAFQACIIVATMLFAMSAALDGRRA